MSRRTLTRRCPRCPPGARQDYETGSARVFWTGTVIGGAIMAWGITGLVVDNGMGVTGTRLLPWLLWFLGALFAHDAIVVPLTLLTGRAVARVRPLLLRTPLQVWLGASAIVTLYAFPLLRGYGKDAQPGNQSVQPLNYTVSWLAVIGLLLLAAVGLALWTALRRRRAVPR